MTSSFEGLLIIIYHILFLGAFIYTIYTIHSVLISNHLLGIRPSIFLVVIITEFFVIAIPFGIIDNFMRIRILNLYVADTDTKGFLGGFAIMYFVFFPTFILIDVITDPDQTREGLEEPIYWLILLGIFFFFRILVFIGADYSDRLAKIDEKVSFNPYKRNK